MRAQMTVYLHADTKAWLRRYAKKCGQKESEVVRLLVEREQEVEWLRWALGADDPARSLVEPMPRRQERLPRRWDDPPRAKRGRKPKKGAK